MKFGKQILAQQVPGWSVYYLDYKSLKKIVSSLASGRPATEAAALAVGARPSDILSGGARVSTTEVGLDDLQTIPIIPSSRHDDDRGPAFQAHKTAFFFKLERELEKINSFYLQKEAELKLRVETLLSKRRAAATRVLPDEGEDMQKDHVEWKAVEEGFRLLERDLAKLQQFVDLNATGFRKILKKWDKRSKSTTKELYLSRQVEVQPVFDRQLIAELSDIVASCLLDLTDLSVGLSIEGPAVNDMILTHQIALERSARMGPFHDLETSLLKAIGNDDEASIREVVKHSDTLYQQPGGKMHVTRILWKAISDAPPNLADLLLSCPATPFDFHFVDDINGRTCLHEAAINGQLRLLDLCLEKGVQRHGADVYGRTALHYASMNGHDSICRRLISAELQPSSLDKDNYTPLMYAVLKSHVECVRVFLEHSHIDVDPGAATNDLTPLSLACQVGHVDVVLLLLQSNAKCVPNTNGEYPIHLAAREGHADICRLLTNLDGWDQPDKYNDWTPLFHAARYGHESCVKVLLELGSRVGVVDETGKQAIFYAAWYGHLGCVQLLLGAGGGNTAVVGRQSRSPLQISPHSDVGAPADTDLIPSLSLPPPIMPYRVYGHNYLDKSCLVHVSVGLPFSKWATRTPAVRLIPRITGPSTTHYPLASPLFKLVMTSKPDITSAPYSVSIPVREEKDIFTFQTSSLDALSLEFSIYPNFGTKTIGRAIALSSLFQGVQNSQAFFLPILDHHLHVIGEVAFEVSVITPFRGVTLEIGGAVETYWKSLALPFSAPVQKPVLRMAQPARAFGSTHTSPSIHSTSPSNGHTLTLSSLSGEFIHLVVQVTRDLQPVIFNAWKLPIDAYDLGVAEVTYAQIETLSERLGKAALFTRVTPSSPSEWHQSLSDSMLSLRHLMMALPPSLGVYLDLAFAPSSVCERHAIGRAHDPNQFVDAVLRAVYHASPVQPRRRIVFGSFSPDICSALNWKQPNYPVFISSECGVASRNPPSATALGPTDVDDRRLSSISAAVEWAKINNLLGVFLDADILNQVPALIQGVKDAGLLIGAYGVREQTTALGRAANSDSVLVDAYLQDGVVSYLDHAARNLV